jgi:hypothetical protein
MCKLLPSPRSHGFFLNNAVLILDSDVILAAGPAGTATHSKGYLIKEVRGELRKRHVVTAPFGKVSLCSQAQQSLIQQIANLATQTSTHPGNRLSLTDWSLIAVTACLAGRIMPEIRRHPAPSPILLTGERAIVAVANSVYGLHPQIRVSTADPNRFWYFISDSAGSLVLNQALNSNTLPLLIP